MIELLENPLIQLVLIVAAGMGLSWLSERQEQRRVAQGLPYRPLKERVLDGLGYARELTTQPRENDDIWVQAAKELELPIEKVLLLKQKILGEKSEAAPAKPKRKQI